MSLSLSVSVCELALLVLRQRVDNTPVAELDLSVHALENFSLPLDIGGARERQSGDEKCHRCNAVSKSRGDESSHRHLHVK